VNPGGPRRNRDREVLEAAVALFGSKGYRETSIQDIADAVGVHKASVYHYVTSKEDLLFQICQRSDADASGVVRAAEREAGAPLRRLGNFVEAYVTYCLGSIEWMRVYTREAHHLSPARWDDLRAHRRSYEGYVERLLCEALGGGAGGDTRIRETAHFIFGAINGLPDWYREDGPLAAARIAKQYARLAAAATRPATSTSESENER
jgi:AcrR family transcriptional regulator